MSLEGTWQNSYGSIISLKHEGGGRVYGSYQSTTGSTGTYYVLGYADTRPPMVDSGRSVSLSIFWRSIGDDPEDPSWHWVSALGGQLLGTGRGSRLLLMHDMVVTAEFPGQASIGRHIDKLIFEPESNVAVVPVKSAATILAEVIDRRGAYLGDDWIDPNGSGARMRLRVLDARFGFAEAKLELYGRTCEAWGFVDAYASRGGCALQAISLSALLDRETGETVSLSGWCDLEKEETVLSVFKNAGTSREFSYTQTLVDQLCMVHEERKKF